MAILDIFTATSVTDSNFIFVLFFQIILSSVVLILGCLGIYKIIGRFTTQMVAWQKAIISILVMVAIVAALGAVSEFLGL